MATNPLQQLHELGQSPWNDNIRRWLLVSGDFARLVEDGITGVTSNPTIFEKAISGSTDYEEAIRDLVGQGKSIGEIYEALVVDDIRMAADILRPVWERTGGADGYVSVECSPEVANDTAATITEARRWF